MTLKNLSLLTIALAATGTMSFVPGYQPKMRNAALFMTEGAPDPDVKVDDIEITAVTPEITKKPVKKKLKNNHKEGVFSPLVQLAKKFIGDDSLIKVRGKSISLHSDVIKSFVATCDTPFGQKALANLFLAADTNGDGVLDEEEMRVALNKLGFSWLKEKQVGGILKRADNDKNGWVDIDEFMDEAPDTLRKNLLKLAKKNGEDMGLLV